MFEINYSQLIQYEVLEKLVTYIVSLMYGTLLVVFSKLQLDDLINWLLKCSYNTLNFLNLSILGHFSLKKIYIFFNIVKIANSLCLLEYLHNIFIVKILNLYVILLCTHLYHIFPVSIHYLQCSTLISPIKGRS